MSMMDQLWDTFSTVIKMNDKVVAQAAAMTAQQAKIEDLTAARDSVGNRLGDCAID